MNETKKRYITKTLEEMNVIDNFLFTEIMADEKNGLEACRIILSCVLGREVRNIQYTAQKTIPGISEQSHGIRLDAYVTEDSDDSIRVYDVEPDKRSSHKAGLPKRSRYYGDLIDSQLLGTGADYEMLPELITIFILSYDPFGEDAMYYEAGTVIKTHPHVPYNDGVRRIYLYVNGKLSDKADEGEQSLKTLLRYISDSTEANATDDNTRKLDDIVRTTKLRKDTGVRFMKSWEIEREIKEDAIREGLAEGRKKGLQEGREKGLQEGREKGLQEGREKGLQEGRKKGLQEGREKGLQEGREKGLQEGREEGREEFRITLIQKKALKGKSVDVIADELELTVEEIRPLYDIVMEYPADTDPQEIIDHIHGKE